MRFLLLATITSSLVFASPIEQNLLTRRDTCLQPDKTPSPVHSNTVCPCYKWYEVARGDDCAPIAAKFDISKDELLKWNPWLSGYGYDCLYLFPQSNVCVGISPPPPPATPVCNKDGPYPVHSDTVCGCKKWYKVTSGDDCAPVAAKNGITNDQLHKWNPWVSSGGHDCVNLFPDSNVCVGI